MGSISLWCLHWRCTRYGEGRRQQHLQPWACRGWLAAATRLGHEGALAGAVRVLGSLLSVSLQAFNLERRSDSDAQLSSPSKTPGMPTRSKGIPSSASASMFSGCSRARRDAKPGVVYCPLARPVFGMSRSLGGFGGGGRALEYLILAMKSWRACEDCEDISTIGVGTNDRCLERGSLVELELWCLRRWLFL